MSEPCAFCRKVDIKYMQIRGGRMMAFNNALVPIEDANGSGWMPFRGAMRPTTEIADWRLEPVRWVAVPHLCREYRDHVLAKREALSFGRAITQVIGVLKGDRPEK